MGIDLFSSSNSLNQLENFKGLNSNRCQFVVLSEFLQWFEDELNLLPSFVVPFLKFQEIFAIILTFIVIDFDANMKFFKRLFWFIPHS